MRAKRNKPRPGVMAQGHRAIVEEAFNRGRQAKQAIVAEARRYRLYVDWLADPNPDKEACQGVRDLAAALDDEFRGAPEELKAGVAYGRDWAFRWVLHLMQPYA